MNAPLTTARQRQQIWRSVRAQLSERRAEPRNWWHDTPQAPRRADSEFNRGTWNHGRQFVAMVPASRYND